MFVIHQMFDGGLVYPTKRDGPMKGLLVALCWPLWAALLTVVIPIEWVRSLRK